MGKLGVVFTREYLERVRTKWFLIATVFGPIFFGAIMILPAIMQARSRATTEVANVVIIDATGTGLGDRIAAGLARMTGDTTRAQVQSVEPAEIAPAESLASASVVQRTVQGYLVLDSATMAYGRVRYSGRNAAQLTDMNALERQVRDALMAYRLEAEGIDPVRATALTGMRTQVNAERLTERGRGGAGAVSMMLGLAVAMLLYFCIIFYGQAVLRSAMEEKQTRVAEVVVSSVKPTTLLAGKLLGVGAVGLTQVVVWVVSGVLLWRARGVIMERVGAAHMRLVLPDISLEMVLALLGFFLLGYLFYAALFAAVGSMVDNEQEAQQAMMPVMVLLIIGAVNIGPVMAQPHGTLAQVVSWLPFSSPVIMPLRMSVTQLPPHQIWGSILVLGLSAALATWLAARIYRVGLLMYGKRPGLRELTRWVRYG